MPKDKGYTSHKRKTNGQMSRPKKKSHGSHKKPKKKLKPTNVFAKK